MIDKKPVYGITEGAESKQKYAADKAGIKNNHYGKSCKQYEEDVFHNFLQR
jgi:hypothetical protein